MDYRELEETVADALYVMSHNGDRFDAQHNVMDAIDKHISARLLAIAEDFDAKADSYSESAKGTNETSLSAWYEGRSASYTAAARRMRNEQTL